MPQVNGKHYSYTRKIGGKTFRSDGKTYTKTGAHRAVERKKNMGMKVGGKPVKRHRVIRLGKTSKYAVYSGPTRTVIPKGPYGY